MLHMTLLERFAQYDWLQRWAPGQAFNNCFLVRKPGLDNPFIDLKDGTEQGAKQGSVHRRALSPEARRNGQHLH